LPRTSYAEIRVSNAAQNSGGKGGGVGKGGGGGQGNNGTQGNGSPGQDA
jgi:hypothetical protein